jgi:hypothetical protein
MAKPYSQDLRDRVIEAVETSAPPARAGRSLVGPCLIFGRGLDRLSAKPF